MKPPGNFCFTKQLHFSISHIPHGVYGLTMNTENKKTVKGPVKRFLLHLPFITTFFFIAVGCSKEKVPVQANVNDLAHLSAESCSGCHNTIYNQWKSSMHANSTALKDPIHRYMYEQVMGSPTQKNLRKNDKYPMCLKCHAPLAALDNETDLSANPVYNEGVTCTVCHGIESFKGSKTRDGKMLYGVDAYTFTHDKKYLNAGSGKDYAKNRDALAARYHIAVGLKGNATVLRTNDTCMGCHDVRKNGKGNNICETGNEYRDSKSKTNCVSCHMPVVNGMVDHSIMGGHDPKMVSRGLKMTLSGVKTKDQVTAELTLTNRLPHDLPTGAPFRNLSIQVTAFDREGNVVWQNYTKDAKKESPQHYLTLVLGDPDGKEVSPPGSTQIIKDKRLQPHETRKYTLIVPVKNVAALRAVAHYALIHKSQARAMADKVPEKLKRSNEVSWAEFRF